MGKSELLNKIIDATKEAKDLDMQHWLKYEFLTWQWWLGLALIILPLCFWWHFVDKKRLLEISLFGSAVVTLSIIMDVTGSGLLLWIYPIRILPQTPLLFPVDIVDVPVVLMLIYQRYGKWGKFLFVNAISSAIMSFVLEPGAVYIGMYKLITWKYIYSFPLYVLIAVMAKVLTGVFRKKQLQYRLEI